MKLLPRGGLGTLFPLVVLLLLAMLTFWLARTIRLAQPPVAAPINRAADYVVEKFTLTRLSDTGEQRYVLTADRMLHFPADDSSLLVRPRLSQALAGEGDLRIIASRGVIAAGGEETYLHDEVEIVRAQPQPRGASRGAPPDDLRITTSYLRVVPDDDRADTPAAVRVERGSTVLTGTGMLFDNRYRRVRLDADVRAIYTTGSRTAAATK